ncbi:MAG: extracellular solute-binding protein [Streptosporangiaceae bacterium]
MSVASQRTKRRTNNQRIPRRGCIRPALVAACALVTLAGCTLLASCTGAPSQPAFKSVGPLITLRIGVYADPGYQPSGLYAQYERLHPDIRIVQSDTAAQASYWPALQGELRSGHGLDDIQAVPVADIGAVTGALAGDFVPLNTLGGVSGGTSTFADDWLPWVARQAMNRAGTTYALGAEIGPIAACYRTSLLAEAGLPTSPAGGLAVRGNPAIKAAWDTAVRASHDGLSAGLAPQTAAWDRGVTRGAFATMMCPAWMLHQVAALAGPLGSGGWNVTAAPGGAGNSGGFYLALPKAGRHQQAAFQLASFLTGEQAGAGLFRTQGDFPANFAAVTAVESVTSGYFSGARVGKIFSQAADRTPGAPLGPASAAITAIVDGQLAQVEAGRRGAGPAWRAALRQAQASAGGAGGTPG